MKDRSKEESEKMAEENRMLREELKKQQESTIRSEAEFVEKYTHKGTKVIVEGEIRTGSYTNREGRKVYTTEIYVSDIEFAESKAAAEQNQNRNDDQYGMTGDDGFMNIPDGEELPPFN